MSDQALYPVKGNIRGLEHIVVSWQATLGANPDPDTIVGKGVTSVTWVSDGKWKVTFSQPFKRILTQTGSASAANSPAGTSYRCIVTDADKLLPGNATYYCHVQYQEDANGDGTWLNVDVDCDSTEHVGMILNVLDTTEMDR